MSKEQKVIVVSYSEFSEDEFKPPATYYFKDALGNFNFLCGRDRLRLQQWVDDNYGKGKYRLAAAKQGKGGGEQSAVGRINSKSRAGSRPVSN